MQRRIRVAGVGDPWAGHVAFCEGLRPAMPQSKGQGPMQRTSPSPICGA